jgi:hypothetical protein
VSLARIRCHSSAARDTTSLASAPTVHEKVNRDASAGYWPRTRVHDWVMSVDDAVDGHNVRRRASLTMRQQLTALHSARRKNVGQPASTRVPRRGCATSIGRATIRDGRKSKSNRRCPLVRGSPATTGACLGETRCCGAIGRIESSEGVVFRLVNMIASLAVEFGHLGASIRGRGNGR